LAHRAPIWDILAAVGPDRSGADPSPEADAQKDIFGDNELKNLAEEVMNSLSASGLAVAYKVGDEPVICHLSLGATAPPLGATLEIDYGISGLCMREGKPQICADTENFPGVDREASRHLGVFSVAVVPVLRDGKVIGVVESLADRPNAFTRQSLRQLEGLAHEVERRIVGKVDDTNPPEAVSGTAAVEADDIAAPETAQTSAQASEQDYSAESSEVASVASFPTESQDFSSTRALPDAYSATVAEVATASQPKVVGRIILFAIVFILLTLFALFFVTAERHAGARSLATNSAAVPSPKASNAQPQATSDEVGTIAIAQSANDAASNAEVDAPTVGIAPPGSRAGVAQLAFGKRFESGEGGIRDLEKACTWYILASKAGNSEAEAAVKRVTAQLKPIEIAHVRYNVGKAYATGSGTEQNAINAYFWLQLAEAAGDDRAKREESKLAASMAPSDVERAQQMAATWTGKHQKRTSPGIEIKTPSEN
jgi:TPR repeat protein